MLRNGLKISGTDSFILSEKISKNTTNIFDKDCLIFKQLDQTFHFVLPRAVRSLTLFNEFCHLKSNFLVNVHHCSKKSLGID